MKIEELHINMKVGSIKNIYNTWIVIGIEPHRVKLRANKLAKGTEVYCNDVDILYPLNTNTKRIKIAKKITPPKLAQEEIILSDIEAILSKGTRIKTFKYDGVTRNALIGSKDAEEYEPIWATRINRAVISHDGKRKKYLVCVDNNDHRIIKNFDISKIRKW